MKRYTILLLTTLFFSSCEGLLLDTDEKKPPMPTTHESPLATLLDSLRYALDLPALAGAIVTTDTIVDAQAVGSRRYAGPMNVTNDDCFHLGSNTKAITAVLLGVLVDEGRVSWTTTLPAIFPEHASVMRSEYQNVTVRELLSHSAGFVRDAARSFETGAPREQREEMVAWALTQPPATTCGRFLYSNLGFSIAGAIAEKLADRPYEELVIERVLQPLGITTAGFGPMGTIGKEDQPLQHTTSHSPIEPTLDSDNPPIYSPAGRLHMSIGDWARYIQWVLTAETGQQNLLRPETARALTNPVVSDGTGAQYALGWSVFNSAWANGKVLAHNGSNGMNFSEAVVAPNRRFAVIATTNQGPGSSVNPTDPAVGRLIDFYTNGR